MQDLLTIKQWAEDDRPREKLRDKGRHTLSDAELIAILIGSGNREETAVELSKRILSDAGNSLYELGKYSEHDLMKFNGIGEAKAISIIAALELGRRRKETEAIKNEKIVASKQAADLIRPQLQDLPHEEFWILLLNRSNMLMKKECISKGGINGTVVDARMVFKPAIEALASGIILCHNHPSGNLQPSEADITLTKKLKEAGKLMEINILDHLILTDEPHYSFSDEGKM